MFRSKLKSAAKRILGRDSRGGAATKAAPTSAPKPPTKIGDGPSLDDGEVAPDLEVEHFEVTGWHDIGTRMTFLDIREPHELLSGHATGALLIPMNQIPDRLADLPKGQPVVVYCAHGQRSYSVAHFLREHGFHDAWSLKDGLPAWIEGGGAWQQPPSSANNPPAFALTATARLTEEAATREMTPHDACTGTIQEITQTDTGYAYVLGVSDPAMGFTRIGPLAEADLERDVPGKA